LVRIAKGLIRVRMGLRMVKINKEFEFRYISLHLRKIV